MADEERISHSSKIRKLRKKLRQIEQLERLDRDLTDEEVFKVTKKNQIRDILRYLIMEQNILESRKLNDDSDDDVDDDDDDNEGKCTLEDKSKSKHGDDVTMDSSMKSDDVIKESQIGNDDDNKKQGKSTLEDKSNNEHGDDVTIDSRIKGDNVIKESQNENDDVRRELDNVVEKVATSESIMLPESQEQSKVNTQERITRKVKKVSRSDSLQIEEWQRSKFSVRYLNGHNDIIQSVDCVGQWLLSGSRDTMLKLWDADKGIELRSFGGHTGSVTAVKLMTHSDHAQAEKKQSSVSDYLAISGSKDCSIKLWNLNTGEIKQSLYTFSPVDCLDQSDTTIVSGSDGGKVELWDIETGQNQQSLLAFEDSVTCVKLHTHQVVSSSKTGQVKIWDIRIGSFHPVISSDEIMRNSAKGHHCSTIKPKPVYCLATTDDCVYWGDDGNNIKAMDILAGKIRKLRNNSSDVGMTYSLAATDSLLISGGYNLDTGSGYLNVRSLPDEEYLATIDDEHTGSIMCLTCTENQTDRCTLHRWCTGGSDLKIWDLLPSQKVKKRTRTERDECCVSAKQLKLYTESQYSDTESSDGEDEDDDDLSNRDDYSDEEADEMVSGPGSSWCTIQ